MTALERAIEAGKRAFGSEWNPSVISSAPGRLELLGNHIDYNGGKVLAAAIDATVVVAVGDSTDTGIEIVFDRSESAEATRLDPDALIDWRTTTTPARSEDYARGVIAAMLARNPSALRRSARIAVGGDVPIGFGISSSAALCVSLTGAFSKEHFDPLTIVLIAQEAEHRLGAPCGTMDQLASVTGGVVIYSGADNSASPVRFELGEYVFAVADSGVHRQLSTSSYPKRVAESKEALEIIRRQALPELPSLAALSKAEFERLEQLLEVILSPALFKRVRHVVTESSRVEEGIAAVDSGDWPRFGRLMTASGRSSAKDYEISHPRVEALVAESQTLPAVLGARMMGGGEGGTALILLESSAVPALVEQLERGYYEPNGLGPASERIKVFGFAEGASVRTS
jgi:galactokinase